MWQILKDKLFHPFSKHLHNAYYVPDTVQRIQQLKTKNISKNKPCYENTQEMYLI